MVSKIEISKVKSFQDSWFCKLVFKYFEFITTIMLLNNIDSGMTDFLLHNSKVL